MTPLILNRTCCDPQVLIIEEHFPKVRYVLASNGIVFAKIINFVVTPHENSPFSV